MADPLPTLLVTGALGAGKTTLINALLQVAHGRRLAAIVNDFGLINIDEVLLSGTGNPVYGLKNGCICCSLQGDLLRTIHSVLACGRPIDGIVIEASGVSDPRGIIEALHDPVLRGAIRLDNVVGVIDAENHDRTDPLWRAQVVAADFIAITKASHAHVDALQLLQEHLRDLQKTSVFIAGDDPVLPFELLFARAPGRSRRPGARSFLLQADDRFVEFEWSSGRSVPLASFQSAIQRLTPELMRAKGFLSLDERPGESLLFQLVGRRASLSQASWATPGIQLAFIGRAGTLQIDRAKAVLDAM